ncbi:MAG TPA: hypothetical protein VEX38_01165 [Fimbriimonadaceae bacterium]|nr:hypothetical protein [Fimbriimonadaceae bacterium]
MSSGETIDTAAGAYQVLAQRTLRLTVVPSLLCTAAFAFVFSHVLPMLTVTESPDDTMAQILEALASIGIGLLVALPLFLIGVAYSTGVITMLVSDYATGNVPNAAAAQAATRRQIGSLVLLTLRQTLIALSLGFVGAGLLMVAAIVESRPEFASVSALAAGLAILAFVAEALVLPWVMTVYALTVPVLMIEGSGISGSVRRSKQLLRGMAGHETAHFTVIGVLLVIFFLVLFIWIGGSQTLGMFGAREWLEALLSGWSLRDAVLLAFDVLPFFIALWFVTPVWGTAVTIIYYERRTRIEGYDIEILAQEVWRSHAKSRFQL